MKGFFVVSSAMFLLAGALSQQSITLAWQQGRWTEPDKEYKKIRSEIERLALDKPALDRIVMSSRKRVMASTGKPTDLYRWALAVLHRSHDDWDFLWRKSDVSGYRAPSEKFARLSQPASYEFTRVQFLYQVSFSDHHHLMVPLGERLHAKDPRDLPVSLSLLKLYEPQIRKDDEKKGKELIKVVEATAGSEFRVLANAGLFFELCWSRTKSPSDAREAYKRLRSAYPLSHSDEQRRLMKESMREIAEKVPNL